VAGGESMPAPPAENPSDAGAQGAAPVESGDEMTF
jgi:hypothetical protein